MADSTLGTGGVRISTPFTAMVRKRPSAWKRSSPSRYQ